MGVGAALVPIPIGSSHITAHSSPLSSRPERRDRGYTEPLFNRWNIYKTPLPTLAPGALRSCEAVGLHRETSAPSFTVFVTMKCLFLFRRPLLRRTRKDRTL